MRATAVPLNEFTRTDYPTVTGELSEESATDSLTEEKYPLTFVVCHDESGNECPINVDPKTVRPANRRDQETVVK